MAALAFQSSDGIPGGAQIRDQSSECLIAIFATRSEHCRWMHGRKHRADADWSSQLQDLATLFGNPKRAAEQRPGGCGAQTDDQRRIDQRQLSFQPGQAGLEVTDLRCGVNSPLASLRETEVLHRIGDVHVLPRHPNFIKRILQ